MIFITKESDVIDGYIFIPASPAFFVLLWCRYINQALIVNEEDD